VYQKNNAGTWWVWRSQAWASASDPTSVTPPTPTPTPTPPPTTESKTGTTVVTVGPSIINSVGEVWTLSNTGTQPMQVVVNGKVDTTTGLVVMLYYANHLVYQSNNAGGWWSKSKASDSWTQTTDPRGGTSGGTKAAPPQAVSAGYSKLVFDDDFTTTTTIATSQMASSGFNWYWAQRYGQPASPSEWTVNTTATAASISNGNSGGGPNASSAGGILQVKTGKFPNANIISLPGWAMNSGTKLPAMGTGHWQRCYMEAYIQYIPDQNQAVNYQQTGWPAFWSWAAEGIGDYGFPGSGLQVPNCIEVDFLEQFGHALWDNGSGNPLGQWSAGLINHGGGGGGGFGSGAIDKNWHTYGFLWTPGRISMWFDNQQKGSMTLSSGATALDQQSLFITIGTGPNWLMNIDWVRVWQ